MQVGTPPPLPNQQAAPQQDIAARMVQQLQPQIGTPQTQRAVQAAPKSEGKNRTRDKREGSKGESDGGSTDRGSKINLRV